MNTYPSPRKRKGRNTAEYTQNKVKQARLHGQSYISNKGKEVPPKHPEFQCKCHLKCLENLGEDKCVNIFKTFYDLPSKNEQDLYLQGLIDIAEVQRRRPRSQEDEPNQQKVASFFYFLLDEGGSRIKVCFNAFLSVLNISEKRVRRIRQLKMLGKTPEDKRGKGVTYSLPKRVHDLVTEHIKSYPLKESHYSGKKVHYLSSDLTLKHMWQMFLTKYPGTKVSYTFFWNFYRQNFNFRIGRPQVDTCSVCETLKNKIKSPHLNETAKRVAVAELLVHKRKSNKFYKKLDNEVLEKNDNVLAIAFDYMKTTSLPKIPVQDLYYQLSCNIFTISEIKNKKSTIYLYHEGNGKKGPNEVCSFLYDFLKSVPAHYTELHIYSDNCGGQNKNFVLSRFALFLTDSKRFEKVVQYFPSRGHSFLPCDRDFGMISRHLSKHDRIFTTDQVKQLILSSSQHNKFTVKEVVATDILNFKTWQKQYYKKTCISKETRGKNIPKEDKVHFLISTFFQFNCVSEENGMIKAFTTIDGLISHTFPMGKTNNVYPPSQKAYPEGKIPFKEEKKKDILKLIQFVPMEFSFFYEEFRNWPTTNQGGPDSDFEDYEDVD